MAPHGEEEPLRPIIHTSVPPWYGSFWCKDRWEYNGRKDWWTALGDVDAAARLGLSHKQVIVRERNPNWFEYVDSKGKFHGFDISYNRDPSKKGDTPVELKEYNKEKNRTSPQFQELMKHWKISKEHPGIYASFNYETIENFTPGGHSQAQYNRGVFHALDPKFWGDYKFWQWGPHFFDSPLNQDQHVKAFVAAKYMGYATIPMTMFYISNYQKEWYKKKTTLGFLSAYAKFSYRPILAAGMWGLCLSSAATLRNVDDVYNHVFASGGAALATYTLSGGNTAAATLVFINITILGMIWHAQRASVNGLQVGFVIFNNLNHLIFSF
ncbi:hypothetical protein WR25_06527 [Diploscapter pachys]|uniref:Uncharacterized protein n=1 Tax=Diploscapter pachys TaxID=2018661 RepID=A0A2A2K7Z2_9BILA|nr:hypothetical protein WR25_06527 [Diploscapter pachys]